MNEETNRGHGFWSSKINVAAAAVVGLIIVIGLVVLLLPRGGDPDAASPGTASQPTDETTSAASNDSCPGLADNDDTTITAGSLDDTQWELRDGVAIPTSEKWGPGKVEDGIPSCFAKTPQGVALMLGRMATMNLIGAGTKAVEAMTVDDENREAALKAAESSRSNNEQAGGIDAQIAGIRIESFDKDAGTATATLVVSAENGTAPTQYVRESYQLRWVDGDWKVEMPSSGLSDASQLPSLDGFTRWSGVGNG